MVALVHQAVTQGSLTDPHTVAYPSPVTPNTATPPTEVTSANLPHSTILYVETSGKATNNGSSWSKATTLQNALAIAQASPTVDYEIWVASGTYTPCTTAGSTFSLSSNIVALLGGFKGTESSISQEPLTDSSVLSGSLSKTVDATNVLTASSGSNTLIQGFSFVTAQLPLLEVLS